MFGKYKKLYSEYYQKAKDLAQECDKREADHYNLNLYIYWLEKNFPDVYDDMQNYFEGMPGYYGLSIIKDNFPDDFFCNC